MRMRKKKNGAARIAACAELLIEDTVRLSSDPGYAFSEARPLYVEIGCGKGSFACGMAAAHPEHNFIAMEKVPDVACLALEKARAGADERVDNLRFLIGDAKNLTLWFPPRSVDGIYLNFSDPWPKSGHAKRRLTHRDFLERYRRILKPDGRLYLKTDNEGLFDFSLEEFAASGLVTEWLSRDLHRSERAESNVMTEYEANFSAKGQPIYSAQVRFAEQEARSAACPDMSALVLRNRSYRSFDPRVAIPEALLLSFVNNARLTPSTMNKQPLKYKIVSDKEGCDVMLAGTRWAAALPHLALPPVGQGPTAYIIICRDTAISENNTFDRDVGIAAQTIMLSATAAGFGGCMIATFSPQAVAEAVGLPEGILPVLVLGLGKPAEQVTLVPVVDGKTAYFRDESGRHFVPKRALEDILL